jgi:hypothetical protein
VITLIPESTDLIIYTPKVNGAALSAAPNPFSVVVTDEAGNEFTFTNQEQWNATSKTIEISVEDDDISTDYLNTVLTFEYRWEYDSQSYRDIERALVVNPNYESLIVALRRKLGDSGDRNTDTFVVDGSGLTFYLTSKPIKGLSETVFLDGVTEPPSSYIVNYGAGVLTFDASGYSLSGTSIVEVRYTSYTYSDVELEGYLMDAIDEFNDAVGTSYSNSAPSLDRASTRLVLLMATRSIYRDKLRSFGGSVISWRDEEKSVTRANHAATLEMVRSYGHDIDKELMSFGNPIVLSGGLVPFDTVDALGE